MRLGCCKRCGHNTINWEDEHCSRCSHESLLEGIEREARAERIQKELDRLNALGWTEYDGEFFCPDHGLSCGIPLRMCHMEKYVIDLEIGYVEIWCEHGDGSCRNYARVDFVYGGVN